LKNLKLPNLKADSPILILKGSLNFIRLDETVIRKKKY